MNVHVPTTALILAVHGGHRECVRVLMEAGAEPAFAPAEVRVTVCPL